MFFETFDNTIDSNFGISCNFFDIDIDTHPLFVTLFQVWHISAAGGAPVLL